MKLYTNTRDLKIQFSIIFLANVPENRRVQQLKLKVPAFPHRNVTKKGVPRTVTAHRGSGYAVPSWYRPVDLPSVKIVPTFRALDTPLPIRLLAVVHTAFRQLAQIFAN